LGFSKPTCGRYLSSSTDLQTKDLLKINEKIKEEIKELFIGFSFRLRILDRKLIQRKDDKQVIKKAAVILVALCMAFSPVAVFAKGFSGGYSTHTHHSSSSYNGGGNYSSYGSSHSSNTYHSGYHSPSSQVSQRSYSHSYNNQPAPAKKSGGFLSHAAAFGAGALLGSMLHPFGGSNGYTGYHGFSLSGLFLDIIVIGLGLFFIRRLLAR
jgi:hypothetical protein